jgi:hypothetical protein
VHGLFEFNPMDPVSRPPAKQPPVAFFELDVVERIVAAQMTPELQAFYAIAYGTGIETASRSISPGPTSRRQRRKFEPREPRRTPGTGW